jgi:hypothetical protein
MSWPIAKDYEPTGMYISRQAEARRRLPDLITIDSRLKSCLKSWLKSFEWIRLLQSQSKEETLLASAARRTSFPATELSDDEMPSSAATAMDIHRTAFVCRDAGVAYGIMTAPWIYKDDQPAEEEERIWLTHRGVLRTTCSTSTARKFAEQ